MKVKSVFMAAALLFATAYTVSAQREKTLFNSFGLTGIWGGSSHQLAQFGDTRSYMRGGHFGLEFGKALNVGFSSMSLKSDPEWDRVQDQEFGLNWRGGYVGYALDGHKAIHPVINVAFGPGKVRLDHEVDRIFAVQPSAGVEINIFRWMHLGLEGGYRFITDSSIEGLSDSALSGAFGQATLRFGWSWGRSHKSKRHPHHTND